MRTSEISSARRIIKPYRARRRGNTPPIPMIEPIATENNPSQAVMLKEARIVSCRSVIPCHTPAAELCNDNGRSAAGMPETSAGDKFNCPLAEARVGKTTQKPARIKSAADSAAIL